MISSVDAEIAQRLLYCVTPEAFFSVQYYGAVLLSRDGAKNVLNSLLTHGLSANRALFLEKDIKREVQNASLNIVYDGTDYLRLSNINTVMERFRLGLRSICFPGTMLPAK